MQDAVILPGVKVKSSRYHCKPTLQQEVILARMEQILASRALTDDERAQLLYERGVLYDSLGLRALARNDFSQALAIRPDMPEVFNYLAYI